MCGVRIQADLTPLLPRQTSYQWCWMTEDATSVKSIHALPQRRVRKDIYTQANTYEIFNMLTGGAVVSNVSSKKKKKKVLDPALADNMEAACPANEVDWRV